MPLNDQRSKRHSQRFGGHTGLTRKQFGVAILDIISRDGFGFPDPPVIGIHFQADGLVKISKAELTESILFVHRLYSKVQGFLPEQQVFPALPLYYRSPADRREMP